MVVPAINRPLPRYRKRFVVRGRVVRQESRTTGRWIFKSEWDVIVVEIDREEFEAHRQAMGGFHLLAFLRPKDLPFPSECEFVVEKKERIAKALPVNSSVEVTLGYLSVGDQIATRLAALEVLELKGHANPGYRSEDGTS